MVAINNSRHKIMSAGMRVIPQRVWCAASASIIERTNILSAHASSKAPKAEHFFITRAHNPSKKSVIPAKIKRYSAMYVWFCSIAHTIKGVMSMRVSVIKIGMVVTIPIC